MTAVPTIPWPVDARPRIRVAGVFPLEAKGFGFNYRSHTHALHLHDYAGTIRLGEHDFPLQPGTLTLSPSLGASSYDLPRAGSHWCIHFHPCPVRRRHATVRLPLARPLGALQVEAAQRFAHVARLHAMALQQPRRASVANAAASVALQELLLWIGLLDASAASMDGSPRHAAVEQLLDVIQRELHLPLCVADLARRVGVTQNYLARLFRARTGTTIPHYILTRRIQTARLLLSTTNLPVKIIAARVGMPDPQHFNKQFRRLTGRSPSAIRTAYGGIR